LIPQTRARFSGILLRRGMPAEAIINNLKLAQSLHRQRGVYADLICGDLNAATRALHAQFDLAIALDVYAADCDLRRENPSMIAGQILVWRKP
jgi:hypothetical protein